MPAARPEELARFVPAVLRQRLAADPTTPASAYTETSAAGVLFADISGFTALSERLAERGPEGVEELTQVLNAYFGQLIDLITAHGGDVVKFAGDALLAFWPQTGPEELEHGLALAAQCGLQVQAALATFTSATGHRLWLRIGIGAGTVAVLSVGGVFQRWECVLVGPPVIEATRASTYAPPGSVAVGPAAWQLLSHRGHGVELSAGYTRLESVELATPPGVLAEPPVPAEAVPFLLSYIPAAIHRRMAAGQSGWLAEMRRLTVLFLNLPELNHTTPLARCQEVMQALQTELYHYEGSVNKLSVDEKGVTLVAALGLPPLAHEDDALRGVLAGLAMQARLTQLGWHSSFGVTSGRVFCGTLGSPKRCEYTILGAVVNLSARLMQAAHGGILCDELTYQTTRGRLQWQSLPPIQVKGKTQPVPVFQPLGLAQAVTAPTLRRDMVGRTAEQERLDQLLHQVLHQQNGAVALIEGEAGIGKSTLVANLLERSQALGLTTWLGSALAIERSTPYYCWRPIFRQLFQLDSSAVADREAQRQQVLQQLAFDPDLLPLAPLLDVVLSLDFPATPLTEQMFGEVRLSNTNALLLRLLVRQTARAPLQLILEDCHWLDSASWALARQAAQQVPALLLVLVTRPLAEPLPRDYVPLASAPGTQRIRLSPLSGEESLALVQQRLGVDGLPPAVTTLLASKAQGNPFFIEELAYALRDSGMIRIHEGQCTVALGLDLNRLPFPDKVQGVVTNRIDLLAPAEQLTLKVASVIGATFSHNLLRDVCPIAEDKPHLGRHLETLVRQSLTTRDSPAPDPAYRFKHIITQEVAYQLMPPAQRKTLHQSVAEWYEARHHADLSPYYPLLAKHWCNTDQVAKALDYLEKSGENANRDCAHQEAVTFFTQALALNEQTGGPCDRFRVAGWQRQLAEAYYNLSDLDTARKHYRDGLRLLGYPLPASGWGFVLASLWEFAKQGCHRLVPRWFLGRAGNQAARRLEAARAYERLVQIFYLNNAKVPSIHAAYRALNLSETVGESPELARNYAHAAVFSGLLRMHRSAQAYAERARVMAAVVDQPSCTAYVAFIRGVYWVTVGAWEAGEEDLVKAIQITERIGEKRRWYESTFTLANVLSRKGDYVRSAALSGELHQSGTRHSVPQVQIWGLSWQLWCRLALDPDGPQLPSMASALAGCLGAAEGVPLADQILGYGLLALARWRRGQVESARDAADAAEEIIGRTNQVSHYLLPAYVGLAEVYVGLWEAHPRERTLVEEMRRRTHHLCKLLGQFSQMYPIGQPDAWLVRGHYERLRGRAGRAQRAWNRSLAAAGRYRMPYEKGRAHAALGRYLPPGDPASKVHRSRARECFGQIGAGYDLRQLDREGGVKAS
jgi:class 3 adenylate cyclase/tetratricopeptide (TPR) repeat protein